MIRVEVGITGLAHQVEKYLKAKTKIQRNRNLREDLKELEDKSSKSNM